MRLLRLLCCAAALTAFLAPAARADEFDKLTYLTFSGPVQIPGATLAPGTYMFKLADSMSDRHIVQVFDKSGGKLYATLLAIPDKRMDPPDKNIVLFAERPAGSPQAIKAWWYPGDSFGDEFVYPKSQAMKIAKDVHQPVLSMDDEGSSDRAKMKGAKVGRVNENGEVAANDTQASTDRDRDRDQSAKATTTDTAKNKAATTTDTAKSKTARASDRMKSGTAGAAGTTGTATGTTATDRGSANRSSAAAQSNTANNTAATSRRHLPRTASNLPIVALLSGLALAGAASARQLRKRSADRA